MSFSGYNRTTNVRRFVVKEGFNSDTGVLTLLERFRAADDPIFESFSGWFPNADSLESYTAPGLSNEYDILKAGQQLFDAQGHIWINQILATLTTEAGDFLTTEAGDRLATQDLQISTLLSEQGDILTTETGNILKTEQGFPYGKDLVLIGHDTQTWKGNSTTGNGIFHQRRLQYADKLPPRESIQGAAHLEALASQLDTLNVVKPLLQDNLTQLNEIYEEALFTMGNFTYLTDSLYYEYIDSHTIRVHPGKCRSDDDQKSYKLVNPETLHVPTQPDTRFDIWLSFWNDGFQHLEVLEHGAPPQGEHPHQLRECLITDYNGNLLPFSTPLPDGIPAGVTVGFLGHIAPLGWHLCNGSRLDKTLFEGLFEVIGNTYAPLKTVTNIDLDTGVLTVPNHGFFHEDYVRWVCSTTPPPEIDIETTYRVYVLSPETLKLQYRGEGGWGNMYFSEIGSGLQCMQLYDLVLPTSEGRIIKL